MIPILILWRGDEAPGQRRASGVELAMTWATLIAACSLFWYALIMWVTA